MSWARRKDASHAAIVEYVEAHGLIVFDVSGLAKLGFDIVVYSPALDKFLPVELKTKAESKARAGARRYDTSNRPITATASPLTDSEVKAKSRAPIPTATTGEEVVRLFHAD